MSVLEKLEIGLDDAAGYEVIFGREDYYTIKTSKGVIARNLTENLATEIRKRCNAYPDQQALIKQLCKACKRANQRLSEHGDTERMITRKKLIYALAAAKENK